MGEMQKRNKKKISHTRVIATRILFIFIIFYTG